MNVDLRPWLALVLTTSVLPSTAQPKDLVPVPQRGFPLPAAIQQPDAVREIPAELKNLPAARSEVPARTSKPVPAAQAKVPAKAYDKLKLLNGDLLSGKFTGMKDGAVLWEHPAFNTVVAVDGQKLESLSLVGPGSTGKQHGSSVELINGDMLQGDLVELNDKSLLLDTWYGGKLEIPRESVLALRPGLKSARVIYQGPEGGPDGWKTGNRNTGQPMKPFGNNAVRMNQPAAGNLALQIVQGRQMAANVGKPATAQQGWRYNDNGFLSSTSGPILGRDDLEMPDKVRIEFDIQWANYFGFGLNIFTDNLANEYSGNSYSLRFDHSNVYVYRYRNGSSSRVGGNVPSQMQQPMTRAHITVCVDKNEKTIAILVNGKLLNQWKDPGTEFAGKGKGLLFTSRNSYPMRLSGIRITEWDGNLPESKTRQRGNGESDFVQLKNEDLISGTAKSIKDGNLLLSMKFADVPVKMEDVAMLELNNSPVKEKMGADQVLAHLPASAKVSLKVLGWEDGKVLVESPHFGKAAFDPGIFRKLEFNRQVPRKATGSNLFGP